MGMREAFLRAAEKNPDNPLSQEIKEVISTSDQRAPKKKKKRSKIISQVSQSSIEGISQTGSHGSTKDPEKGFYIHGWNDDGIFPLLNQWCQEHPEKWVYIAVSQPDNHNYSEQRKIEPDLPWEVEVCFYDKKPFTSLPMEATGWTLYQTGCEGIEEKPTSEQISKALNVWAILGDQFMKRREGE